MGFINRISTGDCGKAAPSWLPGVRGDKKSSRLWRDSHPWRPRIPTRGFVRVDVELAVEALAQVEEGEAVHVKVVAAAGADGEGRHKGGDDEQNEPDGKDGADSPEGGGEPERHPDRRHVDGDDHPEPQPALPDQGQPSREARIVAGRIFVHAVFPLRAYYRGSCRKHFTPRPSAP